MIENEPRNITEKLIYEVHKRPLLWDRYNDLHSNRLATDREWLNLSQVMNKHKDFLRQKWKNLRDQFQREFRKVQTPVGDSAKSYCDNYTGKWIYFEQLLFLKDAVKAKQYNRSIEEAEITNETVEELIEYQEEPLIEVKDCYNANSENPLIHQAVELISPETCAADVVKRRYSEEEIEEKNDRKRKASEEPQDPIKFKRLSLAEDSEKIDDDLHFLTSLVPFMRKLNPIRKLIVRNEIQNILLRENLCDKCNGHLC